MSDRIKTLNDELLKLIHEENSLEQIHTERTRQDIFDLKYLIQQKIAERDAVQEKINAMEKEKMQLLQRASRSRK